jgi:hypothetical protein
MKYFILPFLFTLNVHAQTNVTTPTSNHLTGNTLNDEVSNVQSSNDSNCAEIAPGKSLCGDQLSNWCVKHARKKACSYYTKENVIYSKGAGTSEDASGVEVKAK